MPLCAGKFHWQKYITSMKIEMFAWNKNILIDTNIKR